jgi:DNA-binding transcriptional LysR family regulator
MTAEALGELRIADVITFLAVNRHGSITGAARDRKVTPSQVSKAAARLEAYLERPLLSRRSRGIALSEEALRLLPGMEALVESARVLQSAGAPRELVLTVAAPSYLGTALLPSVVSAVTGTRIRGLEVGPAFMRAYATEGVFEAALSVGEERMPAPWVSTRVGEVRRALFASPAVARRLGPRPTVARLRAIPFVSPIYNSGGQFMPGDDGCPLRRGDRVLGHEAATVGVAMELAAASEQVVFGPEIAARSLVRAKRLVELDVHGWRLVDDVYFHANGDFVLARVQRGIVQALRRDAATGVR